jgi:hypothetical protein
MLLRIYKWFDINYWYDESKFFKFHSLLNLITYKQFGENCTFQWNKDFCKYKTLFNSMNF